MTSHFAIAIAAAILTAISQILMKIGARSPGRIAWRTYLNPWTISAYATLVVVTLMNLYAFKTLPLKAVLLFSALALCLVVTLSVLLLGERLTRMQILGVVVTLMGLFVFNL